MKSKLDFFHFQPLQINLVNLSEAIGNKKKIFVPDSADRSFLVGYYLIKVSIFGFSQQQKITQNSTNLNSRESDGNLMYQERKEYFQWPNFRPLCDNKIENCKILKTKPRRPLIDETTWFSLFYPENKKKTPKQFV